MVLLTWSINSFWAARSLVFRLKHGQLTERDSFFPNISLSEVIGARESKRLVCNSYLLRV